MNTKVKFALVGAALVMGACADYYYALPDDYDQDTYLKLNPDVKYYQIINMLRTQDNKPRLDSMQSQDAEIKAEATALYNADNDAFLADEALAKKAFLMAGYSESMWAGAEALNKEQKAVILRYNKQQIGGAPNSAADMAYIDNFQYDPELYQMHYAAFGILEGRPYRVCTQADITIPAGYPQAGKTVVSMVESNAKPLVTIVNLADTLGARPRMMDYSAYYFCKNEADGRDYPIWNEAGAERLSRIRAVQDSLLVANPPEPEPTEEETAKEETSSGKDASATESASTEEGTPAAEEATGEEATPATEAAGEADAETPET